MEKYHQKDKTMNWNPNLFQCRVFHFVVWVMMQSPTFQDCCAPPLTDALTQTARLIQMSLPNFVQNLKTQEYHKTASFNLCSVIASFAFHCAQWLTSFEMRSSSSASKSCNGNFSRCGASGSKLLTIFFFPLNTVRSMFCSWCNVFSHETVSSIKCPNLSNRRCVSHCSSQSTISWYSRKLPFSLYNFSMISFSLAYKPKSSSSMPSMFCWFNSRSLYKQYNNFQVFRSWFNHSNNVRSLARPPLRMISSKISLHAWIIPCTVSNISASFVRLWAISKKNSCKRSVFCFTTIGSNLA